jgi:histidinol dehydrogenase
MMIKKFHIHESALETFLSGRLDRTGGTDRVIEEQVRQIVEHVKIKGDRALKQYTQELDHFDFSVFPLRVSRDEQKLALERVDKKVIDALECSAQRIRNFHMKQKEDSWKFEEQGIVLGQIIRPLERVGIYVPGGKAAYPSTVLMNAVPAQVAGVKDIAMTVPAPGGKVNPYVLAAATIVGVDEIYRIGGAQAIAAMAYGTESIKRVHKIVGPGNIYVATAKKMVFGVVDIDMIAGPSELLIIADQNANAAFIAADMLSQAEHDEAAISVLVTNSEKLADKVEKTIITMLESLSRNDIITHSLSKNGALIITQSLHEAATISNMIAPEHLEIMTDNPEELLPLINHAGAIFLGKWTPEPLGDYAAGPNHTLPTGGTARFSSPLGVYDFIKRSSLLQFTEQGFRELAETVAAISDVEGLDAHSNAVRVRK